MTMKKSLIALAVSSAVVAPASVQAAEVYGSLNTTLESTSTDNGGVAGVIFNTTDDEAGFGMSDTLESRFGVTGSEDLGNGLSAGYTFEFGIGTSSNAVGGATNEDANVNTRLANISLSGDFGQVKLGTMWGVLYSYAGWNHYRTDGHGGATHYYMTSGSTFGAGFATADDPSGLRVDNTIAYTYGGGGYSSDPFTFTVALRSKDGDGPSNGYGLGGYAANDDEEIDNITIGAQGTFGDFTVNGTFYSESNSDTATGASTPDPSMITLGGRWSSGPFYVGGTFFQADRDQQASGTGVGDDPSAFNVLGGMDFGSGYSGYLGVGVGDNDTNGGDAGDMSTFFLQAQKEFTSRTKIYGEFETVEIDGGSASDPEQSTLAFGVKHSF